MKTLKTQTCLSRKGAEFSTDKAFVEASTVVKSNDKELKYSGIPLDCLGQENEIATSNDELHCFIIGDTGCGKTRRLIVPSIILMGKAGESMVISDPKGELYRKTAGALGKRGYDIKVVNMRSPAHGQRWNPFTIVEKLYRSGNDEDYDRAMMITEDILEVLHAANRSAIDPYWDNAAIQYIKALVFMILDYGEPGALSFATISDLEYVVSTLLMNESCDIFNFMNQLPIDSQIRENLIGVVDLTNTDRKSTLGCILSTARAILAQYTRQKTIRSLLSATDFDILEIGKRPTALYIILPDDSEALYPLATLMVQQIYSSLVNMADSLGGKVPNRVSFILDEFANFTKLPAIGSMLTASRSRGIRFVLVCQNVGQLEYKYDRYGAETIRSNCRVWVYMGCRNIEFLKTLQDLSGIHVERYGSDSYPLLDIDMLQRLKTGEAFIFNDRCSPKLCNLLDYSQYDFGCDEITEVDLPGRRTNESIVGFDFFDALRKSFKEHKERELIITDDFSF